MVATELYSAVTSNSPPRESRCLRGNQGARDYALNLGQILAFSQNFRDFVSDRVKTREITHGVEFPEAATRRTHGPDVPGHSFRRLADRVISRRLSR